MSGHTKSPAPPAPAAWPRTPASRRRSRNFDPARYTRFVGIMRLALPAAAIFLLMLLVAWPMLSDRPGADFAIVMEEVGEVTGELRMVNPHYTGTDARGRTFSVTAKEAFPDKPDPDEIRLTELEANILDDQGQDIHITANTGYYYPKWEQLRLEGNIRVNSSKGYTALGEQAEIDLQSGTLISRSRVRAEGPLGTLEADTMRAGQADETITFEGGVKMTINPKNQAGGDSPANEDIRP